MRHTWAGTHLANITVAALALAASTAAVAKDIPTTCDDICDTLSSTQCNVTTVHDVVPGSDVDCGTGVDIDIDSGELRVHDGKFILRGKSLGVASGGKILADCPQSFTNIGFDVHVEDDIHLPSGSSGKLSAQCGVGGGAIRLTAGNDVTISALGVQADGTAADAPGGSVTITAADGVTIDADVTAEAQGGAAHGGAIEIRANSILLTALLNVKGYGGSSLEMPGGSIVLDAEDDVLIPTGGGLDATSAKGGGGDIVIEAGDLIDCDRPLKARGTSGSSGVGGSIALTAERIAIDNDVTVIGGHDGGTIQIEGGGGGITIGTGTTNTTLDATGSNGETGGAITIRARGSHVTLGAKATLLATGASGGSGGQIRVAGVDVTTNSAAKLEADGASPGQGGEIEIESRDALTLAGTIQANTGGGLVFLYRSGTPSIASGITGYDLVQVTELATPCGDGVRLAGEEECDGADLGIRGPAYGRPTIAAPTARPSRRSVAPAAPRGGVAATPRPFGQPDDAIFS